jgi:hypothetical protein
VNAKTVKTSFFSRTALHLAAEKSNLAAICVLLEFGADLWAQDANGMTPLMCALRSGVRADTAMNLFEAMRAECLATVQEKHEALNDRRFMASSGSEEVRALRAAIQREADELFLTKMNSLRTKAYQTAIDMAYAKKAAATTTTNNNNHYGFIIDWHEKNVEEYRNRLEGEVKNEILLKRLQQEKKRLSSPQNAEEEEQQRQPTFSEKEVAYIRSVVDPKVNNKFPVGPRQNGSTSNVSHPPEDKKPRFMKWIKRAVFDWRSSLPFISSFGLWIAYILTRNALIRRGWLPFFL